MSIPASPSARALPEAWTDSPERDSADTLPSGPGAPGPAPASPTGIDSELDPVLRLARRVFVYDRAVVYASLTLGQPLEPVFARALGRLGDSEDEVAWGERAAHQAFETGQVVRLSEKAPADGGRAANPEHLALPIADEGRRVGSVVFTRFGGPAYSPDQTALAGLIASHLAITLRACHLAARLNHLDAQGRLTELQNDFVATVSHELRTPLGFIKGYVTTLLRQDTEWDPATRREFLSIVDEESDRLRQLIDNLLDSSRLQSGQLQLRPVTIHLPDFLSELVQRAQAMLPGLRVSLRAHEPLPPICADRTRLAQVVDNLIVNAYRHAPGSDVIVHARPAEGRVQIGVEDHGPGIPEAHRPHIFDRFYRVDGHTASEHRGLGLGLFICREIAQAHGGRMSLECEAGRGCTFICELPVAGPSSGERQGEESVGQEDSGD